MQDGNKRRPSHIRPEQLHLFEDDSLFEDTGSFPASEVRYPRHAKHARQSFEQPSGYRNVPPRNTAPTPRQVSESRIPRNQGEPRYRVPRADELPGNVRNRTSYEDRGAYSRRPQREPFAGSTAQPSGYKDSFAGRPSRHLYDYEEPFYGRPTRSVRDYHKNEKQKKRLSVPKMILAIVLALVLLVGCSVAAFAINLDNALSLNPDTEKNIKSVLAEPKSDSAFYMLLIGSDSREGAETSKNPAMQGDQERSDVMILLRVDAEKKTVTMVSVPRDTPYTWENGTISKINEVYNYDGAAGTIKAVSELTGVPISHYAEVHFSSFQSIVDAIGGIRVNVPVAMSYKDALTGEKVTLQPGEQTLNGQQAQIFARTRKVFGDNQEAVRQGNIRTIVEAIVDKVKEKPLYEMPGTILTIAECVNTDMKTADVLKLATSFLGGSKKMTMYSTSGPYEGDYVESLNGLWLCYQNPEGWKALMASVETGNKPEKIDFESTAVAWNEEESSAPAE